MDSSARLKTAFFGIKDGLGWVSRDVFVTRRDGGLLVEGWVGPRLVTILIGADFRCVMPAVWSKLDEVAIEGD